MACSNCNSNNTVTIGAKQYCTNCGAMIGGSPIPAPKVVNDLTAASATTGNNIAVTINPVVQPKIPSVPAAPPPVPNFDIAPALPTVRVAPSTPNPASTVHSRITIPARSNVLDLRSTEPVVTLQMSAAAPIITPSQPPPGTVTITKPVITPAPSSNRPSTMDLSSRPTAIAGQPSDSNRLDRASAVPQSNLIQKFHGSTAAVATAESASLAPKAMPGTVPSASMSAVAAGPTVTPAAAQTVNTLNDLRSSLPSQSSQPAPQVVLTPTPSAPVITSVQIPPVSASFAPTPINNAPAAVLPNLPNHVATQIDSMKTMTAVTPPTPSAALVAPKPKAALKPAIQPTSLAAAALAVIIMGGYIWVNNYPKMSIRVAAGKAGFEATLPGYVPNGYSLGSNISYAPGQVTIPLASANRDQNLNVVERRTSWDAASLLDNFVSRQSNEYTSVPGQGLTIYLYGENQASWVNHGIWYTLEGDHRLGRDQLLKLAYSL